MTHKRLVSLGLFALLGLGIVLTFDFTKKQVYCKNIYAKDFYIRSISKDIKKRMSGKSYQKNSNISYQDLRYVRVLHYDFKGEIKTGELIVNKKIAKDIVEIFYELYQKKYPIQRMRLVDEYNADDIISMEANNTSAFNYRTVDGSKASLSMHAYGLAIDINPRINPCITKAGKKISPANGTVYKQRNWVSCKGKYKDYMIQEDDFICKLFLKHGFSWGGDWNTIKDYQHFYKEV